jgi:hypothetical protein
MIGSVFTAVRARPARMRCLGPLVMTAVVWLAAGAAGANADVTATTTFTAAGDHSFTVPAGVTSVTVTAIGAAGGALGQSCSPGCDLPGEGATVTAAVPVLAGQQLFVGVGGPGNAGSSSGGPPGSGGIGGGGAGGSGQAGGAGGGGSGGGGASVVGVGSASPSFSGLLVVAGGGGGTSADFQNGGNAGSPGGNGDPPPSGGGAGSQTAGGAGGTAGGGDATAGSPGSFGLGGTGGDGDTSGGSAGGGGGGGGYYGGGGGGGTATVGVPDGGAGGGGGSSFVTPNGLTMAAPTPTASPAIVSITYDVPTADESTTSLAFGTQAQNTAGAGQTVSVTNNGSAALVVSGVLLGGSDPGDYLVDNRCQQPVEPGLSCTLGVRFDPQAQGPSTATLTLLTNAATAPASVSLSGTGGSLPAGAAGQPGATGPKGATGAKGARGPAGKIELVTCKLVTQKVKGRRRSTQKCTGRTVSGTVKFTTTRGVVHATLARRGVVYARGARVAAKRGGALLVLNRTRRLVRGEYTLTLRHRRGHGWVTSRRRIALS